MWEGVALEDLAVVCLEAGFCMLVDVFVIEVESSEAAGVMNDEVEKSEFESV